VLQLCAAHPAAAQSAANAPSRWQAAVDGSARYYSWSNSIGGSGAQLYVPLAAQLSDRPNNEWKLDYLVRSGTIWARQTTSGVTAESSGLTDTTVSTTATYYGWNGVQPYAAFSVNMPTANATRSGSPGGGAISRTDSDIVASPTIGEGWNFGPSVGANFALTTTSIISAGFGYTNRGPFYSGAGPVVSRLNPGDVSTFNLGYGWSGERDVVQASLSYSLETISYVDGMPSYRAGDRIIAAVKAGHTWSQNWSSRVAFDFSHFNKNEIPMTGVSSLVRELFNSNSNVYRVSADLTYSKDNYSITPVGSYLYRDRNGYDPNNFRFLPAKTAWSAGLAAQIAATQRLIISLRGERIWVHENESPDKFSAANVIVPGSGVPAFATRGWVASVGANMQL